MIGLTPLRSAAASVRRARTSDTPAIGIVQADVFRSTFEGILASEVIARFEPVAFARAWRESLAAPPPGVHALFVALADSQVVGFLAVGPAQDPDCDGDTAEVTVVGVHTAGRQQGHGSRLLRAGVDHLLGAGACTVTVWVLVHDERTRAFFLGAGFAPDGAHRDRIVSGEGALLREVRLTCALAP